MNSPVFDFLKNMSDKTQETLLLRILDSQAPLILTVRDIDDLDEEDIFTIIQLLRMKMSIQLIVKCTPKSSEHPELFDDLDNPLANETALKLVETLLKQDDDYEQLEHAMQKFALPTEKIVINLSICVSEGEFMASLYIYDENQKSKPTAPAE